MELVFLSNIQTVYYWNEKKKKNVDKLQISYDFTKFFFSHVLAMILQSY